MYISRDPEPAARSINTHSAISNAFHIPTPVGHLPDHFEAAATPVLLMSATTAALPTVSWVPNGLGRDGTLFIGLTAPVTMGVMLLCLGIKVGCRRLFGQTRHATYQVTVEEHFARTAYARYEYVSVMAPYAPPLALHSEEVSSRAATAMAVVDVWPEAVADTSEAGETGFVGP